MTETTAIMVTKGVATGGLTALLVSVFNDVELVVLFSTGVFASVLSFFYDFTHDDTRNKLDFKETMCLMKYIFLGIPMMFVVFYLGTLNTSEYITLPPTVWGLISMVCAGSAKVIVEFIAPILGNILSLFINKKVNK